jgi:CTP:molybdopterin cytidylyltransferase MocA
MEYERCRLYEKTLHYWGESVNQETSYAAVVLAADRTTNDAVASKAGVTCKAFAPVGGTPMIIRVLDALAATHMSQPTLLCGPPKALLPQCPELVRRIESGQVTWIANEPSPSRSAEKGLARVDEQTRVLLTTADHALLTPEIVRYFLRASSAADCDVTVGVIDHEIIKAAFPKRKKTVIRLRDGDFCGCNLYTFNHQGRELISFWRRAEDQRKQPWRLIARVLGWRAVLSYLFGYLTLTQELKNISARTGVRIQAIRLPFAEAGIDVDKADDLLLVESHLNKQ